MHAKVKKIFGIVETHRMRLMVRWWQIVETHRMRLNGMRLNGTG